MTTKTLYHLIVYRPLGCRTWTPIGDGFAPTQGRGNFWSNRGQALEACIQVARTWAPTWLAGPKKWAPCQFKVAEVTIQNDIPDAISPDPSPNLNPLL